MTYQQVKIDLVKLDAHLRTAKSGRPSDIAPGGRHRTGATAIVRSHLDALQRRHDAGATWVEIARAASVAHALHMHSRIKTPALALLAALKAEAAKAKMPT